MSMYWASQAVRFDRSKSAAGGTTLQPLKHFRSSKTYQRIAERSMFRAHENQDVAHWIRWKGAFVGECLAVSEPQSNGLGTGGMEDTSDVVVHRPLDALCRELFQQRIRSCALSDRWAAAVA